MTVRGWENSLAPEIRALHILEGSKGSDVGVRSGKWAERAHFKDAHGVSRRCSLKALGGRLAGSR